jgi:hypothetical protein
MTDVNALLAAALHERFSDPSWFSPCNHAGGAECERFASNILATPSGQALVARVTALETVDRLFAVMETALRECLGALIWTSGSDDFCPGGKARKGWVLMGNPAIEKGYAALETALRDIEARAADQAESIGLGMSGKGFATYVHNTARAALEGVER